MTTDTELLEAFDARAKRRDSRRDFFKAFGTASAVAGGFVLATKSDPLSAQAAPSDADILNFALNLEYLEAQFYSFAANGVGLPANLLSGPGATGTATGGRRVTFTDPVVAQYAREIAADEIAHVTFLRSAIGATAVGQPAIDIGATPDGAFSTAARASGLIPAGASFDPYASDEAFLLAAFIFEDVGVTAYKGASPLLANKVFLEAAAGILAVEAYHAAIIRTTLYAKGMATPTAMIGTRTIIEATESVSGARDSLDGASDLDQGVRATGSGATTASNIAPLDADGIAYSRSPGQVLNIVYLNRAAVTGGGFFPAGVNGTLRLSAAN
ncbi:ferritin-like domain-containing protein [Sphingomonas sp. M1-B02]|uniref:ferritin-like domain-containing protein n=1 Tax=Sphingomonas sp. M1-B02 TaxID=3114300 RepID=UPI00223F9F88|nr:ferritin-like domain-containing protein [Sphingomonas sp. S6-11]UZK67679.1 ferritin-like domain-containing protein [Sphingomonas sp. S6-11]